MTNEIKEKQLNEVIYGLDYIGNKIKNDDGKLELGVNNCKLLLDYITNLQEKYNEIKSNFYIQLEYDEELENKITNLQEELEKTKLENKVLKEQMVAMVQPNYVYGIELQGEDNGDN